MPLDGTTLPPPRYDHPPDMLVIERVLSVTEVNEICAGVMNRGAGQGRVWWGCAKIAYYENKKACLIWRIDDPKVGRHEIGHCSGWSNNHETEAELKAKEITIKPVPKMPPSVWSRPVSTPILPWPKDVTTFNHKVTSDNSISDAVSTLIKEFKR